MNTHDDFIGSYRAIRAEMERFALFLARDRDVAADLLHDAIENALKAWARIDGPDALRPYLVTAMIRLHRRGRKHAARVDVVDLDAMVAPSNISADVAADMRLLRDAIAALPEDQRVCVVLAEVQGWPLADIARVLDISESAVKMRLKRGRDRLRASFTDPRTTPAEVRHA